MPKKPSLPESPAELLEELFTLFPDYKASYSGPIHDEPPSFHSVLIDFSTDFGRLVDGASEKQLRSFAHLVNVAVERGGALENALSTCLLEHLHQIRALSAFRPDLVKLARADATKGNKRLSRAVNGKRTGD